MRCLQHIHLEMKTIAQRIIVHTAHHCWPILLMASASAGGAVELKRLHWWLIILSPHCVHPRRSDYMGLKGAINCGQYLYWRVWSVIILTLSETSTVQFGYDKMFIPSLYRNWTSQYGVQQAVWIVWCYSMTKAFSAYRQRAHGLLPIGALSRRSGPEPPLRTLLSLLTNIWVFV